MSDTITINRFTPKQAGGASLVTDTWRLAALLPLHALVWTFAAWLARGNLDTQGDMVENYVWGIEWQAGYAKHPPLFAWITAAWFKVFPHVDLAYFALSAVNALVGLLGIAALGTRFLPRQLAIVAALAMAVSPLYSSLAIKFNANAVLLSVWPWTAYFFVRYMQEGGLRWALALGAFCALAILGKYFSVVLLLALLAASLARKAWRARLVEPATLLAVAAGLIVLFPHIHWLVTHHFPTFGYASERTGGTMVAAASRLCIYTAAQVGYLLPSFLVVILLVRRSRGRAAKLMALSYCRPSTHSDLWWLALSPLLVVAVVALASRTEMASVWGMAAWFALVPLWLAGLERKRIALVPGRAAYILAVYWLLVLTISAAVGFVGARRNTDVAAEPRAELARVAHSIWRARTGQELTIVAGSTHEAESTAFYSGARAQYWDFRDPAATPWLTPDDLRRKGLLFICQSDDAACLAASSALGPVQSVSLALSKKAWGMTLPARRYRLFLSMPSGQ